MEFSANFLIFKSYEKFVFHGFVLMLRIIKIDHTPHENKMSEILAHLALSLPYHFYLPSMSTSNVLCELQLDQVNTVFLPC